MTSKNLNNSLKILCAILFVLILSSCRKKVEIKDTEFCAIIGALGASCFNLISDNEREIEKEEWDQISFGWICTTSQGFKDIKMELEQFCVLAKCTTEQMKILEDLPIKVQNHVFSSQVAQ